MLATKTSGITMVASIESETPALLPMATKFAPPPIQLPAKAAIPRQASSGSHCWQTNSEMGPPMTTPVVPARSMIPAFGPSRRMPGTSSARMSSSRLAGNMKALTHS